MGLRHNDRQLLELVDKLPIVADGWCKVGPSLLTFVRTCAVARPDLVDFAINDSGIAFVRFTGSGRLHLRWARANKRFSIDKILKKS